MGGAVELHLLDTSDTNRSDETDGDSETAGDEPENNERELDFIIQKNQGITRLEETGAKRGLLVPPNSMA